MMVPLIEKTEIKGKSTSSCSVRRQRRLKHTLWLEHAATFINSNLPAPLNGTRLYKQADKAYSMLQWSTANPAKTTSQFKNTLWSSPGLKQHASERCKLASIVLVQVPGSLEEERSFPALWDESRTGGPSGWKRGT